MNYPREKKIIKPTSAFLNELEYLYSLQSDENEAIDELILASCNGNALLQAKAIGKLRRICFDFFALKYLIYEGFLNGCPIYKIDYSYQKNIRKGNYLV